MLLKKTVVFFVVVIAILQKVDLKSIEIDTLLISDKSDGSITNQEVNEGKFDNVSTIFIMN